MNRALAVLVALVLAAPSVAYATSHFEKDSDGRLQITDTKQVVVARSRSEIEGEIKEFKDRITYAEENVVQWQAEVDRLEEYLDQADSLGVR